MHSVQHNQHWLWQGISTQLPTLPTLARPRVMMFPSPQDDVLDSGGNVALYDGCVCTGTVCASRTLPGVVDYYATTRLDVAAAFSLPAHRSQ